MKKLFLSIALLAGVAVGCSKHDTSPEKNNQISILGKWTYVKQETHITFTDGTPSTEDLDVFDAKSFCIFTKNGLLLNTFYDAENDEYFYDTARYSVSGNRIITIDTFAISIGDLNTTFIANDTGTILTLTDNTFTYYVKQNTPAYHEIDTIYEYLKR